MGRSTRPSKFTGSTCGPSKCVRRKGSPARGTGEQGPRIQTLARGRDSNAGSGWGALQRRPRGKQGARWPWLPVRWRPLCRPTLEAQTERREAVGYQSSPEVIFSSLDCPREHSDLTSRAGGHWGGLGEGAGQAALPSSTHIFSPSLSYSGPHLSQIPWPARRAGGPQGQAGFPGGSVAFTLYRQLSSVTSGLPQSITQASFRNRTF